MSFLVEKPRPYSVAWELPPVHGCRKFEVTVAVFALEVLPQFPVLRCWFRSCKAPCGELLFVLCGGKIGLIKVLAFSHGNTGEVHCLM